MNPLRQSAIIAAAIAALIFGTGCSTVFTRIKERPQAFQKLTPAGQALVQAGKIQNGSSKDAVYIAWGKADEIRDGQEQEKSYETWSYYDYVQDTIPYYDVIPQPVIVNGRRGFVPTTIYNPIYETHRHLWRQVTFQNEKVVAWSQSQFR